MKTFLITTITLTFLFACNKPNDSKPKSELLVNETKISLNADAGSVDSFEVLGNVNWVITISPSEATNWIKTNVTSGSGKQIIVVTALETNYGNSAKNATITISSPGTQGVQSFNILLEQQSRYPFLRTNLNSLTTIGIKNNQDSFYIESNINWKITTNVNWIQVDNTNGNGNAKVFINSLDDNTTGGNKSATITITPIGTNIPQPINIVISQKIWYRVYGGGSVDHIQSLAKTSDNGFIMAGVTMSGEIEHNTTYGETDMWLIKTDIYGNKIWQKTFGGIKIDEAKCVLTSSDGGYVVAGESHSSDGDISSNQGNSDIVIIKTDRNGNKLWQKSFGGSGFDYANAAISTDDGGYLIAGATYSNDGDFIGNTMNRNMLILKLDANGNRIWQKFFGGLQVEEAYSIVKSTDGGCVIAGYAQSTDGDVIGGSGSDAWILKLDGNGNLIWQRPITSEKGLRAFSITMTSDNNYVVAGKIFRNRQTSLGTIDEDLWIAKLSDNGSLIWQKIFGGSNPDRANSISAASDGGCLVGGVTWSNDGDVTGYHGGRDMLIYKIDQNGNKLWQKTLGGNGDEEAKAIITLPDYSYMITGYTGSFEFKKYGPNMVEDGWLIKLKD
ncbi:BACON domain-containing protein [Lacibacter sp.]|uniref:BACON domain-containing protein n=1 Tax=Lacibacter sp. TaxID=1915409 RepID=UPI002B4AED94|nr:BACON domain-containing protein [Lacibacter sp.]HLP39770.1 BACON domain-containing protein [Lacibacter sp.]